MKPGSPFLQALAQLDDPGIPYIVIASNTSLASDAEEGRVRRLLNQVLHRTTSVAFLFNPNDIAVSVASIRDVGMRWTKPPVVVEVRLRSHQLLRARRGVEGAATVVVIRITPDPASHVFAQLVTAVVAPHYEY